jgi:hypothetical protein
MKKFILAAALALTSVAMFAESFAHSLIVNKKSGETVEYKFETDPQVTFDAGDMVIATGEQQVRHAIADLEKLTFSKVVGLDKVEANNSDIRVAVTSSYVSVEGIAPGMVLSIYSLDGRSLTSATADAQGSVQIGIDQLAPGIYVAASEAHSFKFVKK